MEFLLGLIPFFLLFILLVFFRMPALKVVPLSYLATLIIAVLFWQVAGNVIFGSLLKSSLVFVELMFIIVFALLVLNIMINTKHLHILEEFIAKISSDKRVLAMLLAWALVSFIEGIAGFGTPVVLAAPFLVFVGFKPLKAVTIGLIGNSTAVTFGAAGTPVIIGLSGVALSNEMIRQIVMQTAIIHTLLSIFVTLFITYIVTFDEKKGRFKEFIPFAIASALSFSIPYLLTAYFIGPELPSIVGGISALLLISYFAKNGYFIHAEKKTSVKNDVPKILESFTPFIVMVVALILSRTIQPLRAYLSGLTINFGEVLGVNLNHSFAPLFSPAFYFGLAFLTSLLVFKVDKDNLKQAVSATFHKTKVAFIVLIFIISMTQLLLFSAQNESGLPGIPTVLGNGLANLFGESFILFSGFVGALGSFMTGSATVSNLLFASLQADTAVALGASVTAIMSLQLIGAAVGNMISIQNIVMASAAVGLKGKEGNIMKVTIIPVIVMCLTAGLIILLW